jgi:hypothetical protein
MTTPNRTPTQRGWHSGIAHSRTHTYTKPRYVYVYKIDNCLRGAHNTQAQAQAQ